MITLLSAWAVVNGLLMAPRWLSAAVAEGTPAGWFAPEALVLVALMALLPRRPWRRAVVWAVSLGVLLATATAVADVVLRVSLGRPLNLMLDVPLVRPVYHLALGNVGQGKTLAGLAALALALGVLAFLLAWLLTPRDPGVGGAKGVRRVAGTALVVGLGLGVVAEATPVGGRWLATPLVRTVHEQTEQYRVTRRERDLFADLLTGPPDRHAAVPGLFAGLLGHDVLLTFIESYGVAALEDPELAAIVLPRLDTLAARMADLGLYLATGALTSPTRGGQSWYAHGTVRSGLWLQNQLRYDLLMASDRETLVDDFRRAGYRTVGVMPAITMDWPDGEGLGFDELFTHQNIPYAGPPLYWVTMPDQFTWSFLERTVLRGADARPTFVETAMVSSHAPWTPILPLVDWDEIGDGAVFMPYEQEGHPPEELWWDIERLRTDYALSVDYALGAMSGFAERALGDRTLLIVLGDHQAAPWVTGAESAEVPIHVIVRDPALLEPFLAWGLVPGGRPDPTRTPPRMDEFRDWFVHAFSGHAAGAAPASAPPSATGAP